MRACKHACHGTAPICWASMQRLALGRVTSPAPTQQQQFAPPAPAAARLHRCTRPRAPCDLARGHEATLRAQDLDSRRFEDAAGSMHRTCPGPESRAGHTRRAGGGRLSKRAGKAGALLLCAWAPLGLRRVREGRRLMDPARADTTPQRRGALTASADHAAARDWRLGQGLGASKRSKPNQASDCSHTAVRERPAGAAIPPNAPPRPASPLGSCLALHYTIFWPELLYAAWLAVERLRKRASHGARPT